MLLLLFTRHCYVTYYFRNPHYCRPSHVFKNINIYFKIRFVCHITRRIRILRGGLDKLRKRDIYSNVSNLKAIQFSLAKFEIYIYILTGFKNNTLGKQLNVCLKKECKAIDLIV